MHLNPRYSDGRTPGAVNSLETDRRYGTVSYGVVNLYLGRTILSPGPLGRLTRTHAAVRWPGAVGSPLVQRGGDNFDLVRVGGLPEDAERDLNMLTSLVLGAAIDSVSLSFARQWTREARQRFVSQYNDLADIAAGIVCTKAQAPLGAIVVGEITDIGPADGARHAHLLFPVFASPEWALAQMRHLPQPDFAAPPEIV